jgi:hypothetical protein
MDLSAAGGFMLWVDKTLPYARIDLSPHKMPDKLWRVA